MNGINTAINNMARVKCRNRSTNNHGTYSNTCQNSAHWNTCWNSAHWNTCGNSAHW